MRLTLKWQEDSTRWSIHCSVASAKTATEHHTRLKTTVPRLHRPFCRQFFKNAKPPTGKLNSLCLQSDVIKSSALSRCSLRRLKAEWFRMEGNRCSNILVVCIDFSLAHLGLVSLSFIIFPSLHLYYLVISLYYLMPTQSHGLKHTNKIGRSTTLFDKDKCRMTNPVYLVCDCSSSVILPPPFSSFHSPRSPCSPPSSYSWQCFLPFSSLFI